MPIWRSQITRLLHNSRLSRENDFVKIAKMSFPKYDGSKDPVSWFSRCEKFFRIHKIEPHQQVELASYLLEDDAQI